MIECTVALEPAAARFATDRAAGAAQRVSDVLFAEPAEKTHFDDLLQPRVDHAETLHRLVQGD